MKLSTSHQIPSTSRYKAYVEYIWWEEYFGYGSYFAAAARAAEDLYERYLSPVVDFVAVMNGELCYW